MKVYVITISGSIHSVVVDIKQARQLNEILSYEFNDVSFGEYDTDDAAELLDGSTAFKVTCKNGMVVNVGEAYVKSMFSSKEIRRCEDREEFIIRAPNIIVAVTNSVTRYRELRSKKS